MEEDWIEYQCKSGQTMFVYNKVTGEHKWPHGLGQKQNYKIIHGCPVTYKEFSTIAIQTDDNDCNNGCMSMYVNTDTSLVSNTSDDKLTQQKPGASREDKSCFISVHGQEVTVKLEDREQEESQRSIMVTADNTNLLENSNGGDVDNDNGCSEKTLQDRDNLLYGDGSHKGDEEGHSHYKDTAGHHCRHSVCQNHSVADDRSEIPSRNTSIDHIHSQKLYKISDILDVLQEGKSLLSKNKRNNGSDDEDVDHSDDICCYSDDIADVEESGDIEVGFEVKQESSDIDTIEESDNHPSDEMQISNDVNDRYLVENNDELLNKKKSKKKKINREDHPKCTVCEKVFKTKSSLKQHLHTLSHMKKLECIYCKKVFVTKTNLIKHLGTENEKPFECCYCKETFSCKGTLTQHMKKIHTEEMKVGCSFCGKKFANRRTLEQHIRIHTKEKPFECSVCKRRFIQKCNLNKHYRIVHTGEKPFECSVCNKKFSIKSDLKKHSLIHTGEKPFQCPFCERKCRLKSTLRRHIETHMGKIPFEYLYEHLKTNRWSHS